MNICNYTTGAEVGLESGSYDVLESGGSIRVCIAIRTCTVSFPFALFLTTLDATAGKVA